MICKSLSLLVLLSSLVACQTRSICAPDSKMVPFDETYELTNEEIEATLVRLVSNDIDLDTVDLCLHLCLAGIVESDSAVGYYNAYLEKTSACTYDIDTTTLESVGSADELSEEQLAEVAGTVTCAGEYELESEKYETTGDCND